MQSEGTSWFAVGYPHPLRPHQVQALAAIEAAWDADADRAWVVLPPGAGKTVVGLEAARRLAAPTVVLSPNTAIQSQWIEEWQRFTPDLIPAGADRTLDAPITSLTYQSLAVFDPDAEVDEDGRADGLGLMDRLHPNGRALVEAMAALGPMTLVLDECHHLLQVWGRLIAEVLEQLPDASVIGLTATPPDSLSAAEAELVDEIFGPPLYSASVPSLVRDGYLAPYAELAWLVRPTNAEADWLATEAERFTSLQADLTTPGIASVDFLQWLDRRFVHRGASTAGQHSGDQSAADFEPDFLQSASIDWYELERTDPELTAAALRFHHAGLLALPPGAVIREEHRHRPTPDDWVELIKDYLDSCLEPSEHPDDHELLTKIKKALPGVGYQLTRRGIRRGRSGVDRVIARSAAKTQAAVEILATESDDLGPQLRALALCDHEQATATIPIGLRQVLHPQAGSARLLLNTLLADERTRALSPLLITGRTVAADAETATALIDFVAEREPKITIEAGAADESGVAEVHGSWSSRQWVRLATDFFEEGLTRVLIGTRALLGEGWDAQRVNVLVDLTTATTSTAVVQTRGRALRLDAGWPEKVAHTWSVVCVSEEHPGGTGDWDRFVRKHQGYLAVTDSGEIASGVGHVDPGFSPFQPPPVAEFDARNAVMQLRAQDRGRVRRLWQLGTPYQDQLVPAVRIRSTRTADLPAVEPAPVEVPRFVPGKEDRHYRSRLTPVIAAAALVLVVGVLVLLGQWWSPGLLVLAAIVGIVWFIRRRTANLKAGLRLADWSRGPDLVAYGRAVADALQSAGISERGAEAVRAEVDSDGGYRLSLDQVNAEAGELFATAVSELLDPVGTPRYLLPRYQPDPPGDQPQQLWKAGARWLAGEPIDRTKIIYHAVPTWFGTNADRLQHLVDAWHTWISAGDPIRTATPEGTGVLISTRGTHPVDATSALRQFWT